ATERKPNLAGVRVQLSNFGTGHDISLRNLYVHDVNGSNVKSEGGGYGIQWVSGGSVIPSRF
ncbi:MAG: right-handed parallel beta-helix repeat-containing protein, partial [Gemmatimonadales bacterium]|nr:right-handed parallel beta-helix repeat-containing protein [Gemmatimonadales bacterium]